MIKVFYDGSCGLCSKEIAYYIKIAPPGRFDWINLAKTPDQFTELGYPLSQGFQLMHVQDDHGQMAIALDAFVVLWQGLGGFWKVLAKVVKLPMIYQITKYFYLIFAKWRFNKNNNKCVI